MQMKLNVLLFVCLFLCLIMACDDSEDAVDGDTDNDVTSENESEAENVEGEYADGVFVPDNFDFSSFDATKPCEYEGLGVCPHPGDCTCLAYTCTNGKWKESWGYDASCHQIPNMCHILGYDSQKIDGDVECGG